MLHRIKPRFRHRLSVAATTIAIASWAPATQAEGSQGLPSSATQSALRHYDIPGGPLPEVLTRFSSAARVYLAGSTELAEGKASPGLQGDYSLADAFAALLNGTGLSAAPNARGQYVLSLAGAAGAQAPLPQVNVTANSEYSPSVLQQDGLAINGYRSKIVSGVGALGSSALLDTPYSISIVPRELIQNIQAQSPDDIYKLSASTRTITAQVTGWSPVINIRGFNTSESAEDGLRRTSNFVTVMEDKERIEIISGLAGFMYGAAPPAGMINYVYKRPTMERLNSITTGNYGGGQYYVHGDFGGRIDDAGRIGYRVNLVKQEGSTAVDYQKIDRELASGALDWQITDKLLLELNAVYNRYKTYSPSAYWFYSVRHGAAPDASKNWSQRWTADEFENKKVATRLSYQLNDHVALRAALSHGIVERPVQDHTMNSVSAAGYSQLRQRVGQTNGTEDAAQLMADFSFRTGPLAHKLTTGYYAYVARTWNTSYAPNTGYLGPYSLTRPTYVPEPVFPANTSSPYYAGKSMNQNFLIGDEIKLSERWSTLVGVNNSRITAENFTAAGIRSQADYGKSRASPSLSVIFKPVPAMTVYGTYIEGLEMGGRAPITASNRGEIMAPMVSKQKELGIKAEIGEVLLSTAFFDIEKAYEYLNGTTYTQDGRQQHKGWEFAATGKPTRDLTVVGGVTSIDPRIKGGANDGKQPLNVARLVTKVYAEYALPVPGLSLNGGIYYTGKQWANATNTDELPSYTTIDLGARYVVTAMKQPLTFRLNINNVTNKNYWADAYYTGAPRSVAFSAQLQF